MGKGPLDKGEKIVIALHTGIEGWVRKEFLQCGGAGGGIEALSTDQLLLEGKGCGQPQEAPTAFLFFVGLPCPLLIRKVMWMLKGIRY